MINIKNTLLIAFITLFSVNVKPVEFIKSLQEAHKTLYKKIKRPIDNKIWGLITPTALVSATIIGVVFTTGHNLRDIFKENNLKSIIPCWLTGIALFQLGKKINNKFLNNNEWYSYGGDDYTTKRWLGFLIGSVSATASIASLLKCDGCKNNTKIMPSVFFGIAGFFAGLMPNLANPQK